MPKSFKVLSLNKHPEETYLELRVSQASDKYGYKDLLSIWLRVRKACELFWRIFVIIRCRMVIFLITIYL